MKETDWDCTWCVTQHFSINRLDKRQLGRFTIVRVSLQLITAEGLVPGNTGIT